MGQLLEATQRGSAYLQPLFGRHMQHWRQVAGWLSASEEMQTDDRAQQERAGRRQRPTRQTYRICTTLRPYSGGVLPSAGAAQTMQSISRQR